MRLIDANAEAEWVAENIPEPHSSVVIQFLRDCGTIDPETLPIVQELTEKLAQALAERDAVLKEVAGECGLCAHYDTCKKNHYSCTNGSDWEYRGLRKEG